MTQEHTIRGAYIDTLLDGGFTRLVDRTINPTEGYIVGGVTEPTTMALHAVATNMAYVEVGKQYAEFKELWCKYAEKSTLYNDYDGHRLSGVGTWVHDGKIYFDLVQHFHGIDRATEVAKERGEIAIYDCKNQKDITL